MALNFVLKDRKAQSDLERIFPGFIKALSSGTHTQSSNMIERIVVQAPMGKGGKEWHFSIPVEDVESVVAYKPQEWNSADCVPPEGVSMCVELQDQYGHLFRRVGTYSGGKWNILDAPVARSVNVKRFRSWE